MRDALAKTGKVAIGQFIMQGREHLVGITSMARTVAGDTPLRPAPKQDAVAMAAELIERQGA